MKALIIITGTTKGLGNALESELLRNKDNYVISINRKNKPNSINNYTNLNLDLSTLDEVNMKKYEKTIVTIIESHLFSKMVFINNAFSILPLNSIHMMDDEEIIKSCHTNIISAILLLKTFISITHDMHIEKSIINISSGAAKYPIDKWSIYCLSKASIEMFMQSIIKEYGENFNVYNLDPGTIDTEMQGMIRENIPENKHFIDLKNKNLLRKPKDISIEILKEVGL